MDGRVLERKWISWAGTKGIGEGDVAGVAKGGGSESLAPVVIEGGRRRGRMIYLLSVHECVCE